MVLCMLFLALINLCLKQPSHRTEELNAFASQVSQTPGIRSSNVCLILFNLFDRLINGWATVTLTKTFTCFYSFSLSFMFLSL